MFVLLQFRVLCGRPSPGGAGQTRASWLPVAVHDRRRPDAGVVPPQEDWVYLTAIISGIRFQMVTRQRKEQQTKFLEFKKKKKTLVIGLTLKPRTDQGPVAFYPVVRGVLPVAAFAS